MKAFLSGDQRVFASPTAVLALFATLGPASVLVRPKHKDLLKRARRRGAAGFGGAGSHGTSAAMRGGLCFEGNLLFEVAKHFAQIVGQGGYAFIYKPEPKVGA